MQRPTPRAIAFSRGLSMIGRLCLVVSLWRAPVPLVHAHDSDVCSPVQAEVIVEHLVEYHSDVAINSHVDFGWHCHFVILGNGSVPGESSENHGSTRHSTAYDLFCMSQVEAGSALALTTEWQTLTYTIAQRTPSSIPVTTSIETSQFLDTYLNSISLCKLLRVARC